MGQKNSTLIKSSITNNMINKTDLEFLCETVNETNTDVINDIVVEHMQAVLVANENKLSKTKIKASGASSSINIANINDIEVSMTSEQYLELMNDVSNNIASTMSADITSILDNDTLNSLTKTMEDNIKQSATNLTSAGSENKQSSETNITNNITNETAMKFQNIIKNITNYHMENHSNEQCGTNFTLSNINDLEDVEMEADDGASINITNKNNVKLSTECVSYQQVYNNIGQSICDLAGITVVDNKSNKSSNSEDTSAKKTIANEGLGADVGDAAKGLGEGLSDVVEKTTSGISNIFGSATKIIFIIGCVICCVLVIAIVAIGYILTDENGSKAVMGLANTAVSASPAGAMRSMANPMAMQQMAQAAAPAVQQLPPPLPPRVNQPVIRGGCRYIHF